MCIVFVAPQNPDQTSDQNHLTILLFYDMFDRDFCKFEFLLGFEIFKCCKFRCGSNLFAYFESSTSDLASIGRYVLTPDILDILRNQASGAGGEIQLADSINGQAVNNMVETVLLNGKRFDCGDIQGYVEAIKYVASNYKFE